MEPDAPAPETISTPEGDLEFPPDEALRPEVVEASVAGRETPRGEAPITPIASAAKQHKHSLLEEVIDEISHGTLLP
jgi:hypothetical protein